MKRLFAATALAALSFSAVLEAAPAAGPTNPSAQAPRPRIGLVLGGGGARGLAHVGVLEQLERLRVPIDCIAGTSAGALIGGIYASGMPLPEMRKRLEEANWDKLIGGTPDRANLPYLRKKDDYQNLAAVTFGVDSSGFKVPRAVVGSQLIDRFLREMTRDIHRDSFKDLAIPFEAVATDLVSGDMKVFEGGDLAIALRASMAVPGVFDVVEDDGGRLLVDGMFVRNLPVENLKTPQPKGCGADVLIVVDVGTPTLKKDEIVTFLDVAAQAMNVATGRNVIEQRKLLGPQDILIEPDLTGYSPASFSDVREIIKRGRTYTEENEQRLGQLGVSEDQYVAWLANVIARAGDVTKPYDRLLVTETRFVPQDRVQEVITGKVPPATQAQLLERFDTLFDTGDFDSINYRLSSDNGQRIATIAPIERAVGPNYLRFGLDFKLDTYRTAEIGFLINYQMTWLNRWGAQWRNDLRLGADSSFRTEFYQPLWGSRAFMVVGASLMDSRLPLFTEDGDRLFEFGIGQTRLEAGMGYSLGRYGEARLSGYMGRIEADLITGGFGFSSATKSNLRALNTSVVIDQLDNPKWPRNGYFFRGEYSLAKFDSSEKLANLIEVDGDLVGTLGTFTSRATLRLRGSIEQELSEVPTLNTLGGFLQLSGLQTDQLTGASTGLGRIMLYKQIGSLLPQLGSGTYIGGSVEGGKVWSQLIDGRDSRLIPAGSLYFGVDTLLGPLYLGVGYADRNGGQWAGYMYLGYVN
ncbi:patatin-like phospholipase family protein [Niveibacterium sp. 24ML]|uniref:patatin-like phospholipase family protein n=1 Tax=Niveibacterium sp. 24ML TaxID=2985512 RepID=UPI00226F9A64|nr:patatin-like phospholipase family protein [Niveibacterium sp. 24ML]MCX9156903.1 patatin-like phospholipase family protein [Niveibacterium sp. 24ML]